MKKNRNLKIAAGLFTAATLLVQGTSVASAQTPAEQPQVRSTNEFVWDVDADAEEMAALESGNV